MLLGAHFLYRSATAEDLYYWSLYPENGSTGQLPGVFSIRFNRPVAIAESPTGVTMKSTSGYSDVNLDNSALSINSADVDTFEFNTAQLSGSAPQLLIAGGEYRIILRGPDVIDGDSSNYYPASGQYWGTGFPEFCDTCSNNWRVTFDNPFAGRTLNATPTSNSTLDFSDFATTVSTRYQGLGVNAGNGYPNVLLSTCSNVLLGDLGSDRPSSVSGLEARFIISSSTISSILGNYDASASGANRCVRIQFPAGYVQSSQLGSPATSVQYTLQYITHERLAANGTIVQPNQLFSIDFNQQIALSATTTVARLYDVDAGVYVASIPMTTGTNAYVGNGDVSDGMTSDTLYLDFANVYALDAGKDYRIQIPGIAVRKLSSWDFVRYDIDGSEYSFTVANDADAPEVISSVPTGTSVATTTAEFVLTFDEPITLSSDTAVFDIWTATTATATVSSVSNVYEEVSGNDYAVDLQAIVNEAFGSPVLDEGVTYWIRVSANAVVDDEENDMDSAHIFSFTTVAAPVIEPEPEEEESQESSSRSSSGRRSRAGDSSGTRNQNGIIPADSLGQLTDPVYEDLAFGDRGDAVYRLQQALNRIGFYVAEEGPGSPGQETETFATSTRNAVMRFQLNADIVPSVGYFGPITRALLGFILSW